MTKLQILLDNLSNDYIASILNDAIALINDTTLQQEALDASNKYHKLLPFVHDMELQKQLYDMIGDIKRNYLDIKELLKEMTSEELAEEITKSGTYITAQEIDDMIALIG